jgi:probable FeS assembly SUF system protein SufT
MTQGEVTLQRAATAKRIPSGEDVTLPEGALLQVTQALGGSVTVRDASGLYRIGPEDFDAFGDAVAESLRQAGENPLEGEFSERQVWDALRQCFDPEIPVNIVDLGLIYDLRIAEVEAGAYAVAVKMTLTAPGCGMGPTIAEDARSKIEALPAVRAAEVEIVWDPQWTPHMISEEGRKVLGLD